MRPTPLLALLCATATLGGCASPCARVEQAHTELTQPTAPGVAGDHLRLSMPLALVDQVVNRELRGLPRAHLPLPAIAGVSLGAASVGVDRVAVVPGPPEEVSFVADVSVRSGTRTLLPVRVTARVRPKLDPGNGRVVIALDPEGLVAMNATLGPGGTTTLIDALWAQLPGAARMLTTKSDLARLAEPTANQLLRSAANLVERELLDDLGKVARVELDLPPIPVDEIHVRSSEADLVIGVHTPLPSRGAIAPTVPRTTPAHQVELTIHAAAAVELVNDAMRRGQVPRRFELDGNADPNGPLEAHLAWDGAAPKPLLVHAFLLDPAAAGRPPKDCAHVTLGATPQVSAEQGHLVLATSDAKVQDVEGSAAVKAGLFFGGVSRRSFEHVESIAARTDFELGQQSLRAQLQSASRSGDHLVFGLTLSPTPGPDRPRARPAP
ncbi:hypothetical protein [Paraliomyxa miuraensis]|uniref:hypothetical protein n=1 Tax=Paraliomyxa miuraensis TaxID=376150 RepID=UPI00224EE3FE|nr:hypothetical protein [Paraliomyxa miuraensis]MCX4242458.1 hypothetical protein [Paraliomyxa miuraensis]